MGKTPSVIIDETIIKQVAASAVLGSSVNQMATELGISRFQVRKVMNMPEFKAIMQDLGNDSINTAKQAIRAKTADMAAEVTRVLMEQLKENSLEAVKIALRIMGFDNEERQVADTQINVVLPGSKQEIVIPTSGEPVNDQNI